MAFLVNPLSLCIPQSAFEAWLRERGYLEILDKCGLDQARMAGQSSFAACCKLLTTNPFANLTMEDLCQKPVPWTDEFFDCGLGPRETYSWPVSVTQIKLRMEENLRRYTGNYLVLTLVVFLCFLYKVPLAFLGLVSLLGLWATIRKYIYKWGLQRQSVWFGLLLLLGNTATAIIVIYCKIGTVLFWTGVCSFLVLVTHSCFRRITPSRRNHNGEGSKRS
ncbi:hypothetical protein O6H91_Y350800 [Diphasiastrum complanatum]|nr:hypothetical protein O6H91_Y350800 [Diphasiastrum complanatum]